MQKEITNKLDGAGAGIRTPGPLRDRMSHFRPSFMKILSPAPLTAGLAVSAPTLAWLGDPRRVSLA